MILFLDPAHAGGDGASAERANDLDELDEEAFASSAVLASRAAGLERKRRASQDGDDEMEAEPMTPMAATRKALLHTSASMSKLEAFRYTTHTPRKEQPELQRGTLPRRSMYTSCTTSVNATSPSILKLTAATRTPVASAGSRPNKFLKPSPTLLLDGVDESGTHLTLDTSCVGVGSSGSGGGLFDRFRYSDR